MSRRRQNLPNPEYDRHLHCKVQHPITNIEAFLSIVKCSMGIGILEMPRAFCNAGWLNGIIGTFVIGAIMVYAVHLLIYSMHEICIRYETSALTYPECMRLALKDGPPCLRKFSFIAVYVVNIFMCLYHFGVCCIYILFIADNVKQLMDFYFAVYDFRIHILALTLPMISILLIRDLKTLVPFNTIANILLFLGFIFVLMFTLRDLPALSERKMFNKLERYPLYFGTVLFAMEILGVIIAIEHEMDNPRDYLGLTGMLTLGSFVTLCLFSAFGFFGYWRYGCQVHGSITLNLPSEHLISHIAKLCFASAIYLSYALQGYVTLDIIWNHYLSHCYQQEDHIIMEYNVRCSIALMSIFVAFISPDMSVFLPFVASFCLTILGLVLPAVMDLCVQYESGYRRYNFILMRDMLIIAFGVIGALLGTWVAAYNIKVEYGKKGESTSSLLSFTYL